MEHRGFLRSLRGGVAFGVPGGNPSGERSQVHDVPPSALEHAGQDERREHERGDQVHRHGVLELRRAGAVEGLREEHRGIVHEHVHRAELIVGGDDQALAVAGPGQIRGHGEGLAAALAQLGGEGIELGGRARGEHEFHALRGQAAGDVRPQPMRRARDERGAAGEVTHVMGEVPAGRALRNRR